MTKEMAINILRGVVLGTNEQTHEAVFMAIKAIKEQAQVDAVEVVRCKDCKFFDHSDFGKGEEYWCKRFVSTDDYTHCHKVIEDDFCAWGERGEDENN